MLARSQDGADEGASDVGGTVAIVHKELVRENKWRTVVGASGLPLVLEDLRSIGM